MCGIVGYTGREAAAPIVLNGLSKLEYRGYDSAGVAVFNEVENDIDIVKTKGRLKNLLEKTDSGKAMPGGMGYAGTMVEQEKAKLTFADFIGTSDGKAEDEMCDICFFSVVWLMFSDLKDTPCEAKFFCLKAKKNGNLLYHAPRPCVIHEH